MQRRTDLSLFPQHVECVRYTNAFLRGLWSSHGHGGREGVLAIRLESWVSRAPLAATYTVQGCLFSYAYSTYMILKFQKVLPKNHLAARHNNSIHSITREGRRRARTAHRGHEPAGMSSAEVRRKQLPGHGPSTLRAVHAPQTPVWGNSRRVVVQRH